MSSHFGRRETLETRLKSETRERARSSSTSSLGFSLLPRGKRERTLHNYVCLFVLPLIRSVVYCWTLAFLTQFLWAWYAFSLSKQNISFPKRLTAHHNVWWTKPRRGVISMIWITVTRKFENQNSKLQVEVSTQVSCLYANRKKRIPSFQSSFKLSVMKDICLIHRAAPLRRFLLSLWRVFSSGLKSLHIL